LPGRGVVLDKLASPFEETGAKHGKHLAVWLQGRRSIRLIQPSGRSRASRPGVGRDVVNGRCDHVASKLNDLVVVHQNCGAQFFNIDGLLKVTLDTGPKAAFARLFSQIFAEHGLILLDPAEAELHRIAAPLFVEAIERSGELDDALLARNAELSGAVVFGAHTVRMRYNTGAKVSIIIVSDGELEALALVLETFPR
jgi:hypothetical protein